jgi:hypothetical protein
VVSRPIIESITVTNETSTLTWSAIPGQNYFLQTALDVTDTNWTDVLPPVTASGATASQTDATAGAGQKFYRVRLLP